MNREDIERQIEYYQTLIDTVSNHGKDKIKGWQKKINELRKQLSKLKR